MINTSEPQYIKEDNGSGGEFAEKLKKLRRKLKHCRLRKEEYLDGWQRERAAFANFRKENDARLREHGQDIKENIALHFLPVLDNLELAMNSVPKETAASAWFEGLVQIKKQLQRAVEEAGAEEIESSPGSQFDPALHEAAEEAAGKKFKTGEIVRVARKGYKMGNKVIRPARVIISK